MSPFFSVFAVNLRQSILSKRFILCSLGVTVIIMFGVWKWIPQSQDAIYLLGFDGGIFVLITGILPIFPFATTFASEWGNRATSFWMVRTGIHNYAVSKVLTAALSGILVTALGMMIFILIMRIRMPLFSDVSTGDAYATLLEADMPIRYLLFFITHVSLTSALFAVAAFWISTYFPNRFVAVSGPLVLYFILHRFTTGMEIPQYLRAIIIVESTYDAGSPIQSLLLKLSTVVTLCLVMGAAAVLQIRRRVQHD